MENSIYRGQAVAAARRRVLLASTALVASGLMLSPAVAADVQWLPGTANWFTAANWSTNTVPTAADNARVTNAGTTATPATISAAGAVANNLFVNLGNSVIVTGAGALNVTDLISVSSTVATASQLRIENGADVSTTRLSIEAAGSGEVLVSGAGSTLTVAPTSDALTSQRFNVGSLAPTATGLLRIDSGGAVNVAGTGTLHLGINEPALSFIGAGTLQIGNGGASGTLTASKVQFVDGTNSRVVFDHTDTTTFTTPITGNGTVEKFNTGTTIFTGVNTYTGLTTINAGTLQIGNGGAFGSIFGDVVNNGTLRFNRSDTVFYDGVISQTGLLEQSGTGTLVLRGANTYTGGTLISAGTLQVGEGGAFGSIVGNVATFGTFAVNLSNTFTLGGVISGPGAVQQIGSGTTILTGANTYTGGTTITQGTLQLGNGGATGAIMGDVVVDNGTFAINRNNAYVFGGVISGTGAFQQLGTGTTILTGTNSYTGGTIIAAGTLQLGNGGATGLIVGDIVNNGTLALNRTGSYSLDGNISGTGGLHFMGDATVTLSGTNSYAGGTRIAGGSVDISADANLGEPGSDIIFTGGGGVLSINAGLTSNRNITLDAGGRFVAHGNDVTLGGTITGNNLLTLQAGRFTLSADSSTFTGQTLLSSATAFVNGSLANSPISVQANSTLAGTGTVGATTVGNFGTLAPGNSIGTLTVNGALTFNGSSSYAVEVGPQSADRTNASGTLAINGGTVDVAAGGNALARTYTLINAASRTGTFGGLNVTGSFGPFVTNPHLTYDAQSVYLVLDPASLMTLAPAGTPGNANRVLAAIDRAYANGGDISGLVGLLGLNGAALSSGLSQLTGETATGAQTAGLQSMDRFLSLMLDPFTTGRSGGFGPALGYAAESAPASGYAAVTPTDARSFDARWNIWGAGFGGTNRIDGNTGLGTHALSSTAYGVAVGADYRVSPDALFGFAVAGSDTSWSLANGLGSGRSDSFQAGVYGTARAGGFYVSGAAAYGMHWTSTERMVTLGLSEKLTADFHPQTFGGRAEAGYRIGDRGFGVTPYAAGQIQAIRLPAYTERTAAGAGVAALTYGAETVTATRAELGSWLDTTVAQGPGSELTLRLRGAWVHDFDTDRRVAATFQTLPGASFVVNGATPNSDAALVTLGAELRMASGWSLGGKFDGEFGTNAQTYAGTGVLRRTW